ncbi:MAG: MotA/TolQ/ExbB proton channel family protein [Planctomycetota bacterium]
MWVLIEILGHAILPAVAVCSVVAGAIVVTRVRRLWSWRRRCEHSFEDALAALADGGPQRALGVLDGADDPMAAVLRRGLDAVGGGLEHVKVSALDHARYQVQLLERGLGPLATIAQVTPLLGLLGTVVGLMRAFAAASTADQVTPALLADGIHQALGTTAAGLGVAIPVWLCYQFIDGLVAALAERLEFAAGELPALLEGR